MDSAKHDERGTLGSGACRDEKLYRFGAAVVVTALGVSGSPAASVSRFDARVACAL
jgi:hypothetical protein